MKDLGDLHFFLEIEAKRTSTALVLTQTKYTLDVLNRTHMQNSKPCPTPLASGSKLSAYDGAPLSDATEYCSIVGALQYLTLTKPDICYAVNQVCQFMHALTTVHLQAVKRILREGFSWPNHHSGTVNHLLFILRCRLGWLSR